MPVYHVVLFKIKESVQDEDANLAEWVARGKKMEQEIPGCSSVKLGKGLAVSLHRGQGYTHGLVAVLDKESDLPVYASHQSHLDLLDVAKLLFDGPPICVDFDMPSV